MTENMHGIPISRGSLEMLNVEVEKLLGWFVAGGTYQRMTGPFNSVPVRCGDSIVVPMDDRGAPARAAGSGVWTQVFSPLVNVSHLSLVEDVSTGGRTMTTVRTAAGPYITRVWEGSVFTGIEVVAPWLTVSRLFASVAILGGDPDHGRFMDLRRPRNLEVAEAETGS
jgi:hypothetical protein